MTEYVKVRKPYRKRAENRKYHEKCRFNFIIRLLIGYYQGDVHIFLSNISSHAGLAT